MPSKIFVENQTVVPLEAHERLRVEPGSDRPRDLIDEAGVRNERSAPKQEDDPFATFTEWASEADGPAYSDL